MVAKEGGAQVLDGVDLGGVHDRLAVGGRHADVEGGDNRVACGVLAGDIDAGQEFRMVNSKTCDGFHGLLRFLMLYFCAYTVYPQGGKIATKFFALFYNVSGGKS